MASLTTDAAFDYLQSTSPEYTGEVKLTDAEVFYHGGYYALDPATGRITEMADVAGLIPVGVLDLMGSDTVDLAGRVPLSVTGDTAASPEPKVTLDIGPKVIRDIAVVGASAITDVGTEVYLVTDNLADLKVAAAVSVPAVGFILSFESSTAFTVRLYTYASMLQS